jgi:nitroreductase
VAFSMIGDVERATRTHGDRGYRYVHFEAGAIGQRLYLAAEACRMGATGIGAFYDEEVHRYLNLSPEAGQVVYHFAIGYPVPDPRLEA